METLHPVEVRVLGCLVEKDMATPEYYPLTLHSLQNACNQKSSREPVVNYDEHTVEQALELLKDKGFVLRVSGAGHRVEKFAHRLGEKLNLGRRELALVCVLMLRGPQTVGELRGRTERMHPFTDLEEVERVLELLASREPEPLVARLPRGRWAHLLGGPVEASAEPAEPAAPRSAFDARVEALEREVDELKRQFAAFRKQFE
ncbi:MAG TPA: YceH family protein [Bryobacteraceae bacterium]|nr:YceH family protein [Bryobacteraceae bacterium]